MSSVDAAGNPLCAFTSVTSLLLRTLGPTTSPSRSPGALLGKSLEGALVLGTLDLFMRCTFPVPNARVKATERFEAAYPIIKELALVGTPGSKAVKQASQ
ncbi:hypothetical protein ZWY2020_041304 [Hordeum vulgare]|nr:hypothetical protein ZWY2020_041304 [Hordeum vulgare]